MTTAPGTPITVDHRSTIVHCFDQGADYFPAPIDKGPPKYYVEHMKQTATYVIVTGTNPTTFPTTCPTRDT
jgi:hypothetical protein